MGHTLYEGELIFGGACGGGKTVAFNKYGIKQAKCHHAYHQGLIDGKAARRELPKEKEVEWTDEVADKFLTALLNPDYLNIECVNRPCRACKRVTCSWHPNYQK